MSGANVDVVRRATEHFLRTGEPRWELLDPEVEIHDHDIPDAGEYRGPGGFLAWMAHWSEAWESFSVEPEEYVEAGDQVVQVLRVSARGQGSGVALERRDGIVWSLRDGKAVRLDYYGSRDEALEAAGLSP